MSHIFARRAVLVALCAFGLLAAPVEARTPSRASLQVTGAGKQLLGKSRTFALGDWTIGASARIGLKGTLRLRSGTRTTSATGLSVTIARSSSSVSARLGGKRVRLFAVSPAAPAVLDPDAQHASLVGARVALTKAAATRLRTLLKLRRAPTTRTLGKLTVAVAAERTPPVLVPAPPAPVATPVPTASPAPTPTPGPACDERFATTPPGSVDWFGCDLPGNGDLHSWTDYIQRPFPPLAGCGGAAGTVAAGDGATRLDSAYDHRFPITSSSGVRPDGSATIVVQGRVTYTMPAHGIDERIGALRIEIAPGGRSGTVYATGHAKPRDMGAGVCATAPVDYADQPVLALDLRGIAPESDGAVTRFVHVPATITADGNDRIGGAVYGEGAAWGAFTIAIPDR